MNEKHELPNKKKQPARPAEPHRGERLSLEDLERVAGGSFQPPPPAPKGT